MYLSIPIEISSILLNKKKYTDLRVEILFAGTTYLWSTTVLAQDTSPWASWSPKVCRRSSRYPLMVNTAQTLLHKSKNLYTNSTKVIMPRNILFHP